MSNLAELQEAISQAEDGDTIKVTETIIIDSSETYYVGDSDKQIILDPSETDGTVFRITGSQSNDTVWLRNLTICFENAPEQYAVESNTLATVFVDNCTFDRCGGGVHAMRGRVHIQLSKFIGCNSVNGGAVKVGGNAWCMLASSNFSDNSADLFGGAVYAIGALEINDCIFEGNTADNGGAVVGGNISVFRSTITGNQAAQGGGIYSSEKLTVDISLIYDNIASDAGADIFSEGTVTITADDYIALFDEILNEREADSVAWYTDYADSRYSSENPTEIVEDTEEISTPALVFVMYKVEEPEPEPEPEPTPTPKPSTPSSNRPQTSTSTKPEEPEPEPEPVPEEDNAPLLVCGVAEIDKANVAYMIDSTKRFIPAQERLTRGRMAAYLYGLLSDESQAECNTVSVDRFNDLYGSPYRSAVNALTGSGVFSGGSGGTFRPDDTLTYGELLTVLTRFVEPKEGYIGGFNPAEHWAASAAITAASYGWIDDVPINLNAPATYGALVNLLIKIYAL